ncbi:proteasome regulatory particle base subunit [Orbilia oligospora]|uniref:26S proteasome regulatory subunit RPN2 n=1 Tax=Orbilia oligospora TaxID=2813651 RepID=A0A7C8NGC1_ORBOL|nr:proteasome regulatory particle base subunit [Orbilia oligospora]KAF3105412.1 proteasome regulatory particle base subunit [Orbilia oligospora]KAF3115029.1 proteasome regulatory particle base subunit [Orbilia oligospora]KAF3133440.1 proteasome regulatory particle base subunit [Orbilia oligospora]KAF3150155.1 proteasome regulatory particle base subunit [Orbilia oligospora]
MLGPVHNAAGLLGLLEEDDIHLQSSALEQLDILVDEFWSEIADSISKIESLYEDPKFPHRQLAALVASKVYYHLGAFEDSMMYALGAGDLFDISGKSEFIDTIISKCIDKYISINNPPPPPKDLPPSLPEKADPRLTEVVERMFQKCYDKEDYKPALGIAIESQRLDIVEQGIRLAGERQRGSKAKQAANGDAFDKSAELMEFVLELAMNTVQEIDLREKLLRLLVDLHLEQPSPDYFSVSKCVVQLNDYGLAAKLLRDLVSKGDNGSLLIAYQIAFDLDSSATQEFLKNVTSNLPDGEIPVGEKTETPEDDDDDIVEETAKLLPRTSSELISKAAAEMNEKSSKHYKSIRTILKGTKTIELNLEFLFRNNHTEMSILNKIRDCLEARTSLLHNALTFANGFMNAGTLADGFLRANLDWLGKAVNWSKFTATAALGVIHRGNLSQGMKLLQPYLPNPSSGTGSPYSQGGSLYGLGLIYANHGEDVLPYLLSQFKDTQDEIVQHGGALGLGVAGMATGKTEIYQELRTVLWTESAISGEAVGLAMGLIMLGTANPQAIEEMRSYAHETQREKVKRGLALGMALVYYSKQELADELIDNLLADMDPILRYGGVLTIALAYCGTGSNSAIRKVLHVAVSDVNDDVRRVAVFSLGFILFRKYESVPRMVELLAESYNPHVRYGSALALGIACAGTGLDEALDLLQPMLKDTVEFVKQGALISIGMILVQHNEAMNPKVAEFRKTFERILSDKTEDVLSKFGAAVALGLLDAGGRNCTIGLQTATGSIDMAAVVGMACFTQYWYWFPLAHFLSLGFRPTGIIGLNVDLEVPDFQMWSKTKPSQFDYPPKAEESAEKTVEKIATAVLSTTAKARQRAKRTEKERREREGSVTDSMIIDPPPETPIATTAGEANGEGKEEETGKKKATKKSQPKETIGYKIDNMSRVLPAQLKHIDFLEGKYQPVKKVTGGVLLLVDTQPEEPAKLLEYKSVKPTVPSGAAGTSTSAQAPSEPVGGGGAAAAAAVLTQEDDEEDAPVPSAFDYYSDGEGQ